MFLEIKASDNIPATPVQDEHEPLTLADFDALMFNRTTTNFVTTQSDSTHSRCSTPSSLQSQQTSKVFVQSTAPTLTIAPGPQNSQTAVFSNKVKFFRMYNHHNPIHPS